MILYLLTFRTLQSATCHLPVAPRHLTLDRPAALLDADCILLKLGVVAPHAPVPLATALPADGLLDDSTPAAVSLAEQLASIFGSSTRAILHYGSRAQGRATRPDSAFDFFVIVRRYDEAYAAAASALGPRHRPRLGVALAWVLPPNSMAVRRKTAAGELEAKALIISERDFQRECSPQAGDHFVQARMLQTVRLTWARDPASAEAAVAAVRQARNRSFDWARVFLPSAFDLPGYCRTLIATSFAHELRAETASHPEALYAAQQDLLNTIYLPMLARLADRGVLKPRDGMYQQVAPPGPWRRWRVKSYFRWSKVRTSARLLKHPFLYDGWLEYLTRKVDRSTGQKIALSAREQRYPLIFLWPRVIRYLRGRPQRGP